MEKYIITTSRHAYITARHVFTVAVAATAIIFLNACATLSSYQGATLLHLQAEIEIKVPISKVFAFVTDTDNDPLWRSEVMEITLDRPLRVGAVMTERAVVGMVRGYVTRARVTEITKPTHLRVEATPDHPRRFIGERNFIPLSANRTRMIYIILADTRMVSDLWPLPVAPGMAKEYYEARMRINLTRLKHLLEERDAASS